MVLGKICFAINTVCLVFQIILVLRATAKKRENRKNTDYNSNNPIDFISRIPESRSFLVMLAVWAVVVCVAIITTMLVSITAPPSESVQKTAEDKMSSLISQYVDLGNEIIEIYQKKFAAENEFQALVSQLPPQWEEFLLLRHLSRMSFEDIAEEMGYSREWCWKTNKKACAALEELLNVKSVQ